MNIFDNDAPPELEAEVAKKTLTEEIAVPLNDPLVAVQVTTAKKYPRSVSEFMAKAKDIIMSDPEIADQCIYDIPVGDGKRATGPSVRLAEIVISCYKNIYVSAEQIHEDAEYVYNEGKCLDVEANSGVRIVKKKRITYKSGDRYSQYMRENMSNANNSIALRDAVLRIVPRAFVNILEGVARKTVRAGIENSLPEKRKKVMEYFKELEVENKTIYKYFSIKGIEDITTDHIMQLRGIANAIKDQYLTAEDAFKAPEGDEKPKKKPPKSKKGTTSSFGKGDKKKDSKPPKQKEDPKPKKDPEPKDESSGNNLSVDEFDELLESGEDKGWDAASIQYECGLTYGCTPDKLTSEQCKKLVKYVNSTIYTPPIEE